MLWLSTPFYLLIVKWELEGSFWALVPKVCGVSSWVAKVDDIPHCSFEFKDYSLLLLDTSSIDQRTLGILLEEDQGVLGLYELGFLEPTMAWFLNKFFM